MNLIRTADYSVCLRREANRQQADRTKIASRRSDFFLTAENAEMIKEKERLDEITEAVIGAAIEVHRALGPGLLESAYESCLGFELSEKGLNIERQKARPVVYKKVKLDCGYRLDLVVENAVIVEIKAIDCVAPVHRAQLLSYLKLSGHKVGLLINFNVKMLKSGIVRVVNNYPDSPRSLRTLR